MIDEGELDWKIVAISLDDLRASLVNDVADVEKHIPGTLTAIRDWFRDYKIPDGKPANKFGLGNKAASKEVAELVKHDFGSIDIIVHSLANGPEVSKPLLETSRNGYLAAISASSYSYLSLLKHFVPIMNPGGASISLTYIAAERIIPGYGGGMSSA